MNNYPVTTFVYKDDKPVRTVLIDGEPWWVAKDVCDILEIADSTTATRGLDDDEKGTHKMLTPGGMQDMTIISEPGLYTLMMRSHKKEAKPFRRWVTHEVLPSIRRTGFYISPAPESQDSDKPVPLQQSEPSLPYLSRGIYAFAERVYKQALSAKSEEDFRLTAAMDKLFKDFAGKSALEAAGLYINFKCITEKNYSFDNYACWTHSFEYTLDGKEKLLTPLPETWTEELAW